MSAPENLVEHGLERTFAELQLGENVDEECALEAVLVEHVHLPPDPDLLALAIERSEDVLLHPPAGRRVEPSSADVPLCPT